jgi:PAS domain S-box-containing protein
MFTFRHYSITKKLSLMNLLINILVIGAVLFLACLVIGSYDLNTFRANLIRNVSVQSQIIAANSASALRLHDATSATATLSTLKAYRSILSGVIYTAAGEPLAVYERAAGVSIPLPATMAAGQTEKHWTAGKEFTQMRPVVYQGKVIGAVLLQVDLRATNDRMGKYAGIVALVLLFSLPAAFLLLVVLQRASTRPILQLAETARMVSRDKNYSVRVSATAGKDEAGLLITAFNEMLVQIQERDAALQKALDLNRNILDSSTEYSIIGVDLDGVIVLWNEGARRRYDFEPDEVIGKANASILYAPEDVAAGKPKEISDVALRDGKWEGALLRLRRGGERFMARVVVTPRWDGPGKPIGFLLISIDISEEIRLSEELKASHAELERRVAQRTAELDATNKELEAFTYSVAHDLRAPLRHIQGFADLLTESLGPGLEPDAERYLSRIGQGTQHMGNLIEDLLRLAQVSRQEPRLQATGLNSVVKEVLQDLKNETKDRDIQWQVDDLPFVDCDPGLMKQVFYNLLSNAVKYTRPRKPAVIGIGQTSVEGQLVTFVRDNGVGFNMKYSNKLFGVFQRLHRKEDFEGTGVGLATVQRIVHKHGGRIWAEAELDKGATFFFSLAA